MNVNATIRKALYSLELYATQHPEQAEPIRGMEQKIAALFEVGDVHNAIASVADTITAEEKIDCATFGLFCYQVRLMFREPEHPDLALCDELSETIGSTPGWELPYPLVRYKRMQEEEQTPSGPCLKME